jgi:hypothetical protein
MRQLLSHFQQTAIAARVRRPDGQPVVRLRRAKCDIRTRALRAPLSPGGGTATETSGRCAHQRTTPPLCRLPLGALQPTLRQRYARAVLPAMLGWASPRAGAGGDGLECLQVEPFSELGEQAYELSLVVGRQPREQLSEEGAQALAHCV